MRFHIRVALGAALILINSYSFYVVFFFDSERNVRHRSEFTSSQYTKAKKSADANQQYEMLEAERLAIYENLVELQLYMRSEFEQLNIKYNVLKEDKQFVLFSQNSIKRIK